MRGRLYCLTNRRKKKLLLFPRLLGGILAEKMVSAPHFFQHHAHVMLGWSSI